MNVVALPQSGAQENAALKAAGQFVQDKPLLYCDMPMTRDEKKLEASHAASAKQVAELLDMGKNVAFLTLGDPSIYATPMYLHRRLQRQGYETCLVPGVPSFCAVAAALNTSLCEGGEMLHILPASYPDMDKALDYEGNKVLMKSGKQMRQVLEKLEGKHMQAMAVERCGMEGERVHPDLSSLDENASYFSVVVVKENGGKGND